jgi:carbon storage regulator CsrA
MLVITRREGEEVVIGDPKNPIGVVRVASVKGERVRIAFDFPRDIEINRREVADQIAQQASEVIGQITAVFLQNKNAPWLCHGAFVLWKLHATITRACRLRSHRSSDRRRVQSSRPRQP